MILCLFFVFGSAAVAVDPSSITELVPMGHTTGIKLFSDGVMVVGLTGVETAAGQVSPGEQAGIAQGDVIQKINGKTVKSNEQLKAMIASAEGKEIQMDISRNGEAVSVKLTPVKDMQGEFKAGIWIRDSMAGIGTLTFYDPTNNIFGALGHGICDSDTNALVPFGSGSLMESKVIDVKKGTPGNPGELVGDYNLQEDSGILFDNTDSGIFGNLNCEALVKGRKPIPVAKRDEIKVGPATILSNIEGDQVTEYSIEITRIFPDQGQDTKNMMIKVTDAKLIEKTGGIVQGMSGSPILQNGKLVGAVTHVLVNDPQKGYGILIENMIRTGFDRNSKDASGTMSNLPEQI